VQEISHEQNSNEGAASSRSFLWEQAFGEHQKSCPEALKNNVKPRLSPNVCWIGLNACMGVAQAAPTWNAFASFELVKGWVSGLGV